MKKLFKPNQKSELSSNLRKIGNRFLLLMMFLVLIIPTVSAQIDNEITHYPTGTYLDLDVIVLPPILLFEKDSVDIPLTIDYIPGMLTIDTDISNEVTYPCMDAESMTYLAMHDTFVVIKVDYVCPQDDNLKFIEFTIKADNGGTTFQRFRIPLQRINARMVMVLDISGSMILPANDDPSNPTRWDVLKNSVNLFTEKFEYFNQEGDSISVTYFTTDTVIPNEPLDQYFIDVTAEDYSPEEEKSSYIINADMDSRGPMQMTAMGKGLLDAKRKLKIPNTGKSRKIALLFTDGLQNIDPKVKETDGNTFNVGTDSLNNYSNDPLDSINYFTIATWEAAAAPLVIKAIATNNNAALNATAGQLSEFETFFNEHLSNILNEGSPQIVDRRFSFITETGSSQKFLINKHLNKILFEITHSKDDSIIPVIEKDGIDITEYANIKDGGYYKLISFNLPDDRNPGLLSLGEWNIKLTGNVGADYNLTCFVDDHFLQYNCKLDKSVYTVGDPINFKVDLSYAGKALETDNQIEAFIFKPGEDLGHLLATYDMSNYNPDQQSPEEIVDPVQQMFQDLINNDSSFYSALLPEEQKINLTHQGNGKYIGSFANTELTGVYNIIFKIKGEIPNNGNYERSKLISSVVKFGKIEEETPYVEQVDTNDNNTKSIKLAIRPINKYGKYLGPGFKNHINVKIDPKQGYFEDIQENLDGTYKILITNIPVDLNPQIVISVLDETFYEGKAEPGTPHYWKYIILLILLLIIILIKLIKTKPNNFLKVILWILLIAWIIYLIFQYFNIISI